MRAIRDSGFGSVPLPYTDSAFIQGVRNVYVAYLQRELREHGFDPGPIDGIVGPETLAADAAAMEYLFGSPSPEARILMASVEPSVAKRVAAYRAAFARDTEARGVLVRPGDPPPTSPDKEIKMGPADMARTEREFGLAPGWPAWAPWAVAVGVTAAVGFAAWRMLGARRTA